MSQKMLSVDDSALIRKIVRGAAEVLGYALLEASNGQEALSVLETQHKEICLILLDWNMPVLDGFDTLKAVKQDRRFADIPIMMLTTEGERVKIIEAVRAGAKHYMTKPFSQEDLIVRMMECLGAAV